MSEEQTRRKEALDRVETHINQLMEHFDSVQIFCTKYSGGVTTSVNKGSGSWFTRYGQVGEWLEYEREKVRDQAQDDFKEQNQ